MLMGAPAGFLPSAALAAACDQAAPAWRPSMGPASVLDAMTAFAFSPLGLAILALMLATAVSRIRIFPILAAILALLGAAMLTSHWAAGDGVYAAAIREGCRASPLALIVCLGLIALGMLGLALRRAMRRKPDEDPA